MIDPWSHDELGWLPNPAPEPPLLADQMWEEMARGEDPQSALGAAIAYEHALSAAAPVAAPVAATNAIGIDCASYQGQPNWGQVAASGRQFCYLKAGEGSGTSYPSLDGQYTGARAAGLTVGLYWYAKPNLTPEANADAFSAQVNRLGAVMGHLPPCLDLEVGTGDMSGWASAFVNRLRANTGCTRVMVYSGASFFQTNIGEQWMDPNIALWIANFGVPPGKPSYLTPRVAIHQYSATGQVSGVIGNVDLDYAIWPISTLIPPEVELDATEDAALIACYQQMSGSATVGQWTGWPSWPGGSGRSLTMLDYLRQADVQLNALKAAVAALQPAAPTAVSAGLPDSDIARIAAAVAPAVAQALAARLQG